MNKINRFLSFVLLISIVLSACASVSTAEASPPRESDWEFIDENIWRVVDSQYGIACYVLEYQYSEIGGISCVLLP